MATVCIEPVHRPEHVIEPIDCAKCHATKVSLRRCSKCKLVKYCSKACQSTDWNVHKHTCRPLISMERRCSTAPQSSLLEMADLADPAGNNFFHRESRHHTATLVIDTYRFWIELEFTSHNRKRGLYAGEDPLMLFRQHVDLLQEKHLLPDLWNEDGRAECENLAMQRIEYSCIYEKVTETDIMEHYDDMLMPMKMRMLLGIMYRPESPWEKLMRTMNPSQGAGT